MSETIVAITPTSPEDTTLTSSEDAESQHALTRVVVLAIDQSEYSHHAFEWAVKNFLRKESDLVVLVNVRPIPSIPGPYAIGASYMDFSEVVTSIEEQHRVASHALLKDFASRLKAQNFALKAIAMRGDARDEIVRKVSELNADALVLGSRGLGALKRTILGSVSDYCSHHCNCTVVIVKGGRPEHEKTH
ncbi:5171_t:CDS:2 [Acaulospora morrowiae]|uniref:5171_t:CDS:1 n=1 Tax=Acaulospora morrowiae TaxID=94023 RepID=A0A9N9BW24_9GLOM|nr:5171_t:CDS:2 [Acaulospora morrowiae]